MKRQRLLSLPAMTFTAAVLLSLLSLLLLVRYGNAAAFFVPAAVLAVPILGWRLLSNPVPVLMLFLLLIVNLDFVKLGEPGGVRLTADILTSSALLYALMVRTAMQKRAIWKDGVEKAYLTYVIVTFISVLISVSVVFSFKNWMRDLEYLMLLYFITGLDLDLKDRKRLVAAILLSSLIPSFTALLGQAFNISMFYGVASPVGADEMVARVQGTLGYPGTLGHYASLIALLALGMVIDGRWYPRRFLVPLLVLNLTILYLTFARTGWLEFIVGAPILIWIMGQRKKLLIGLPFTILAIPVLLPTFLARWGSALGTQNNSFLWRLGLWAFALTKFPQRPIFGSGPDTFNKYVLFDGGFNAHNTWIKLLIEQGAVGFLAFVILMITVGRRLHRNLKLAGRRPDPLVAATYATWVSFMVGSMGGDPFELPVVTVYFWVLTSLVVGMSGKETAARETPAPNRTPPEASRPPAL